MHRELSSSQTTTRRLARSRNRWIALVRFFFVFSLIATGFSGLAPVVGVRTLETAQANHSNIKLPVPSGESWTISQGYNTNPANGGSHYSCNPETLRDEPSGTRTCSQYWQYKYSFDLVPTDGSAAGRTLLSPVDGTIRWIDEAYGGMSINLADGYALAYFHTTLAPGLAAGQTVRQGQYLGTVAPSGQGGNGGFPHIHITLWSTTDGGNWSRNAVAFSGGQSIEGVSLPALADSSVNQYRGTTFTSTNTGLAAEVLPPAAPVHLSPAHGVTYDAPSQVVTLNWAASSGASEYQVWINDAPASGWISSTNWTTPSLRTGQYAWQVKARGAGGEGSLSGKWVFWVDPSDGGDLPPLSETPGTLGISNSPTSGAPGANIVVTGAGMSANETVNVYWDSVSGTRIGQTVANSAGNWRITFTLPDATGGQHQILARGATSNRNAASTFSVSPSLQRTPISGVPGTSIAVSVKGFGNGELVSLSFYHNGSSVHALGSLRTDANGSGTTTVTLPSSTTGQHDYRAVGTTSGISAWGALWIQPSMTLSSDQGAAGDSVTATVRGMPGSSTVRVSWNESGTSPGTTLCTGTTSTIGSFVCTFRAPGSSAGAYPITATAGGTSIAATFGIAGSAAITITPSSGTVGSSFQISLGGFQSNETVRLTLDGSSTDWRTATAASNGTVLVKATIPYLSNGNHAIAARGVSSGRTASGTVSISPSMELSTSGGASGSSASAWMRGFKADTNITLRFNATNATNGVSSCSGRTDSSGSFDCAFTVPASAPGTYPVRAVSDGLSATTNFAVTTAGEIVGGAVLGIGTYQVTATREGLVGGTTSNGHVITEYDHFVSLPACTPSNCPWLTGGSTSSTLGYITDCGDACFVRVTNPTTGACRVEPIYDVGPWFTNDNWWEPTERRNLNNLPGTVNILPQGYPGTDAARDGLDVGYGLSNGIGISNVGYETGNRAAIDIADGTWQDIGFAYGAGIGTVVVSMLWQTGEDVDSARQTCLAGTSNEEINPAITISSTSGHVGDVITVNGTGYAAGERINIFWDRTTSGSPIAFTTANSQGSFSVVTTIPTDDVGSHYIVGKGATSNEQASRTFYLLPPTRIYIDPLSGNVGSSTLVTGEGFYRNETVTIYWDSTGSTGRVLTTTSANAFGEISANVSIPDSASGSHYIVGKGSQSALQASRTYTVTGATAGPGEPRISIVVTTGFVGAVIEVTGTGYGVGESVEMFWDSTGSTGTLLKTVNADAAGSFATTITVPQTTDGKHLIVGRGTVSNAKPSRSIMIQAAPEITSSPTTGAATSTANITGVRFFGSEQVDIFWHSTSGTPLSTVGANPNGGFTIGIAIPSNASTGEHDVIAKGRTSGFEASVAFDVTAPPSLGITIDPTTGPPGTSITVTGVGFGSNELVIIRWGNTSSGPTLGAVTASSNGSFTTTVTAPSVADGSYRVIAHAQTSGKKPLKDFVVASVATTPQIVFDPMSGVPGTTVTINGTGFEPAEQVNFRWDNTSSGLNLGSVTASGSGTFTTTITVPDASYGPHRLIAHGQTTNSKPFHDFTVTEPVIVDPRISIDPIQGRTGTVVAVSGTNYQPGERVEIRWNSSSSSAPLLGTATADNNGAFTTNVTIPNVEGGTYRIVGKGPVSMQNPTRSFTVTPSIGASTLTAQPGDEVRLTVRGFKAGETIEIYFDSVTSTPLATAQANSIGVAAITIVIPAAVNGTHQILAVGGATSAPPQPITITNGTNQPAEASFATSSSSPGDQPVIDLAHFWSGERVEIFWDDRQTPTSSFVIGGDGSFSGEITVPTLPGGVHDVTVRGVDSGKSAVTTITLVPKVILTPPIGAVDARIVVDVKAWTPGATATIYFNRPEGGSGGTLACSATGRDSGTASCSFNVPSGFAVGTVVGVTATGSPGSATALFEVRNEPVGFAPAEETTEPETTETEPTPEEAPGVDEAPEETPVAEPAETPAAEEPAPEPTPTEEPVVEAPTEEPTVEPTPVPEPRLVTSGAVSDVTVFSSRPDDAATEQFGMLGSGGAEGAVAYLTFSVEGIGGAVVTDARLVITGAGSTGGWESVSVVPGLWIDEASATWNGLPSTGLTAATDAGWAPVAMPPLANGETAWIDVTTSIQGDGVVTFVISGNPDALASFLSRESGNGPRLEITVQD